jgi:hypothetical protein
VCKRRNVAVSLRLTTLVALAISFSACSKDDGVDYCKNHGRFHADHLDAVAVLEIEISDAGDLEGSLSIPQVAFGEETDSNLTSLLGDAKNIFALETERPCAVSVTSIVVDDDGLEAQFAASCGADNRLRRVNVSLFESLGNLEEVVTSVTTSATSKNFGISRQCDRPIFRLD